MTPQAFFLARLLLWFSGAACWIAYHANALSESLNARVAQLISGGDR